MRNFQLIHQGLDIAPVLNEIIRNNDLWNQNTLRTTAEGTPHAEVDDIWLRFNDVKAHKEENEVIDDCESINYPAWFTLTYLRKLVFWLMSRVEGERVGRCLVTRLPPGDKISLHADGGASATYYERYHMVLQSLPGCMFNCGDESVMMRAGEVWWMRNELEHEVINNSADDRIHAIIDLRVTR